MFRSKIHFSHLLVLACIATNAHAVPPAQCNPGQGWDVLGNQTTQQSVCDLARLLLAGSPCNNTKGLPPLSSDLWYKASSFSSKSIRDCACTSTIWNLLTACAACQKWSLEDAQKKTPEEWQSLKDYESNNTCAGSQSSQGVGLESEPDGSGEVWATASPWAAKMDSTSFDLAGALALVNTNSNLSTNAATPPTSTDSPNSASTSVTATNSTSDKPGPNIGAIVGGVVGGIAFLGAIFGLLLFLHRRKRRARDVAPSSEFLKPEYYSSPPLLPANNQRDSEYRDDIEEEAAPHSASRRLSWVGGMVATRRHEDDRDEMLPPFTQGTYIGPSPHEKGHPERRHTDESDATATSNTHLLSSSSRPGTSE